MAKEMELETVNKLFLELSQFATATTGREAKLMKAAAFLRDEVKLFCDSHLKGDGMVISPRAIEIERLQAAVRCFDGFR